MIFSSRNVPLIETTQIYYRKTNSQLLLIGRLEPELEYFVQSNVRMLTIIIEKIICL